jgi:hypothetical protein
MRQAQSAKEGQGEESQQRREGNIMMSVRVKLVVVALVCAGGLLSASSALAAESGPQWTVTSVSSPTDFKPGPEAKAGENRDSYDVLLTNTGYASSDGTPIEITDELPAGLTLDAVGASGHDQLAVENGQPSGTGFSCVLRTCTYAGVVLPDQTLRIIFPVDVSSAAPVSVTNVIRVAGGGARSAVIATPTAISSTPASFGVPPGGAATALSTTQAGAHADLTNLVAFSTVDASGSQPESVKDLTYDLPPAFAGDLIDTPSCSAASFAASNCPVGTQIGITTVTLTGTLSGDLLRPVYNLAPNPGEVARIGFSLGATTGILIEGGVSVRPGDYGLRTVFTNINETLTQLNSVSLTLWGVPADPIHDPFRGVPGTEHQFGTHSDAAPAPFFTNPTSCTQEPLESSFLITSWEHPDSTHSVTARMPFGPIVGCDRLTMDPSLTVEATTNRAYSPTGLDLGITIPQTYENPNGLATSTVKRTVVTLPTGMTVNPSAGAGLGACTEAQYAQEAAQFVQGSGCPNEAKLGEVRIVSPAIKEPITGSVYLASPAPNGELGRNPFNSLLVLYIVARLPDRGIIVKAAGEVTADPVTGQLVTTFDNLPPLPFATFTFKFHSGQTAPLVTPPGCGSYTVQAQLTPLAVPSLVLTPAIPPFPIISGVHGGPCPSGGTPPFHPQVISGTNNNAGGSYSPFYLRILREDGEQELTRFSTTLPPGLTGDLSGIPFCPEADIGASKNVSGAQEETEPSCPQASEIGHTIVEAGVGAVLAQTPGKIYLAGPYHGAPLSIVSITSAKVGPFDLGTVVIRFALNINPITAQVEVSANGSDPIPHIIKGIVVHVRDIRVYMDRSKFIINPTNCNPLAIADTIDGAGADFTNPADQVPVAVNTPFEAADCSSLAFKPSFKATVTGKNSKTGGAALEVNIVYPNTPQGTEANIQKVKVELPGQLPSRLTTLQKACLATVFEANPAGCPAASVVGHATAVTPILPVPLAGPAYFVSYGGAKFPELVVVLQGYGITIVLHGQTFISKKGITSSTFQQVPDQPVTSFRLTLPQGPNSALTANVNLCNITHTTLTHKTITHHGKHIRVTIRHTTPGSLTLPTEMTAQNGMILHRATPIAITGCGKAKKAKKPEKAGRARRGRKAAHRRTK